MSQMQEPLTVIAEAARRMRMLGEAANTDEARRPYSDPRIDPVPESQWGRLINNYLGGEVGEHCAAWTPAVALAAAELLEAFLENYDTELDAPDCPNCGTYCAGHGERAYHVPCMDEVTDCSCLAPYLKLAEIFLGAGMFVGARAGGPGWNAAAPSTSPGGGC